MITIFFSMSCKSIRSPGRFALNDRKKVGKVITALRFATTGRREKPKTVIEQVKAKLRLTPGHSQCTLSLAQPFDLIACRMSYTKMKDLHWRPEKVKEKNHERRNEKRASPPQIPPPKPTTPYHPNHHRHNPQKEKEDCFIVHHQTLCSKVLIIPTSRRGNLLNHDSIIPISSLSGLPLRTFSTAPRGTRTASPPATSNRRMRSALPVTRFRALVSFA